MTPATAQSKPAQLLIVQTQRLCGLLFDSSDTILIRPIETWSAGGKKHTRTLWKRTAHPRAETIATKPMVLLSLSRLSDSEHVNLFYGVCAREGGGGRFDQAWQIRKMHCLWADIDDCLPDEAIERCRAAALPTPSAVVASGNGTHLYWKLDELYRIDDVDAPPPVETEWHEIGGGKKPIKYFVDATGDKCYLNDPATGKATGRNVPRLSEKAVHLQDILKGISAKIGGDHTTDLSRLLRMPGSLNRKNERNGQEPKPCTLVECSSATYAIGQFEQFAMESPERQKRERIAKVVLPAIRKRISPTVQDKLAERITMCEIAEDRSAADFALCSFAIEKGVARDELWGRVQGVGKFAERGETYFDLTWNKAEERTREQLYEKVEREVAGQRSRESGEISSGTRKDDAAAIDPMDTARDYLNCRAKQGIVSRLRYWYGNFHLYRCGRYAELPKDDLRPMVSKFLDSQYTGITRSIVADVIEGIKAETIVPSWRVQPSWLEYPDRHSEYIAFRNGILDVRRAVETGDCALQEPTASWFSPVCLPYDFDPDATCPKWLSILGRNLEHDTERIAICQEFAGYCNTRDTGLQKFMLNVGEGANGKSVFLAALTAITGIENVSNVPLERFGERFELSRTLGKLVNIAAEVGEFDKVAEGYLKSFTSGDRMQFERKFRDPIESIPTAKLILATNNPPRFSDRSGGLWRRMIYMPWRIQIPEAEQVKGMDNPGWWAEQGELPGMFNWGLEGLRRLISQSAFTKSAVCSAALDEYRSDSNPAKQFLLEHYREDVNGRVVGQRVYSKYSEWCSANGYRPLGNRQFGKEIVRAFPRSERKQRTDSDGIKKWMYLEICEGGATQESDF